MAESSDDSGPIGARYAFKAATALQLDSDDDGDKGSPIPEWISQHATPPSQKVRAIAESSDSDAIVDLVSQPPPRQEEQEATKSQHSRDNGTAEPAARKPEPQRKGKEKSKTGIEQSQAEAGTSQPAPRAVAVTEAAPTGTIPVMMPEKLAKGRYLIQLEPNEGGVTDLAGDMGTVGRFTLSDKPGREKDMMLDLKGVIYSTSVVPCATTMCVVNIQPHEAKVEAVMDSFVSLREEAAPSGIGADLQKFLDDDDDAYMMDIEAVKPGKGGKRKKADEDGAEGEPKKKRAATKAGTAKGAGVKRKAVPKRATGRGGSKAVARGRKK